MRVRNDGHSPGLQSRECAFDSHHVLHASLRQGRAVSLKTRWIGVQVPGEANRHSPGLQPQELRSVRTTVPCLTTPMQSGFAQDETDRGASPW